MAENPFVGTKKYCSRCFQPVRVEYEGDCPLCGNGSFVKRHPLQKTKKPKKMTGKYNLHMEKTGKKGGLYNVTISFAVDTTEYVGLRDNVESVENLVKDMFNREVDFPEVFCKDEEDNEIAVHVVRVGHSS